MGLGVAERPQGFDGVEDAVSADGIDPVRVESPECAPMFSEGESELLALMGDRILRGDIQGSDVALPCGFCLIGCRIPSFAYQGRVDPSESENRENDDATQQGDDSTPPIEFDRASSRDLDFHTLWSVG